MKKFSLNPIGSALFVLGLFILFYTICSFIGVMIVLLGNPSFSLETIKSGGLDINQIIQSKKDLIIVQVFGSIGGFLLPVLVFTKLVSGYSFSTLLDFKLNIRKFLISASFIFIGVLVLSSLLFEVNQLFPISDYWRAMEQNNKILQEKLINGKTVLDLTISILVVAVLPAFLEELFFRGLLLDILKRFFKSPHIAIFIQGILFGLAHLNMGQVLPILGIGVLFGYLAYYSKSIWYGVLVHFLNNAFAVTMLFFSNNYNWAKAMAENESLTMAQYAFGIVTLIAGLWFFFDPKKQLN